MNRFFDLKEELVKFDRKKSGSLSAIVNSREKKFSELQLYSKHFVAGAGPNWCHTDRHA